METCQPAYGGGDVLLATYSEGESLKTGSDCQTIPVNNCRNVAKPNCRKIADEQCRKVPNRECGRVPVKECRQVSSAAVLWMVLIITHFFSFSSLAHTHRYTSIVE